MVSFIDDATTSEDFLAVEKDIVTVMRSVPVERKEV